MDIKNITEKIKKTTDDIVEIVKNKLQKKNDGHYLSGKEVRAIAKSNKKAMMALEKEKNRKKEEHEYLATMKDEGNILEIDNLHTYFYTDQGIVKAVNGVSINIPQNATVGIVGESGCGKSVTSMSVISLPWGRVRHVDRHR